MPESPHGAPFVVEQDVRRMGHGRQRRARTRGSLDELREATQRRRATQNRMLAAGMPDRPSCRDLFARVSTAPAMTEAAFAEARRRPGK